MVCDFCARGIEKTFKKDDKVKKIDIDLTKGKVLLAYSLEEMIDFADVKQNILINGQNAVDMNIITLKNNER
jgi:3-isopropylmalate dehydratase small subunit